MVMLYRKALIKHSIPQEPVTVSVVVSLERREVHVAFHFANGACNALYLRAEEAKELVRQLQAGILSIDAL
jgi:hypothetical protein